MSEVNVNDWQDVFYIVDLNDGTRSHRKDEQGHWYNLCIKPNEYLNESRHHCVCWGSNYDNILKCISKYVSFYRTVDNFYRTALYTSRGLSKLGAISLKQADAWYNHYGNKKNVTQYENDIKKAIKKGNRYYEFGLGCIANVKLKYDSVDKEIISLQGNQSELFTELLLKLSTFDGYTKVDLYKRIKNLIDTECLNDIFESLMEYGCMNIKQMKILEEIEWIKIIIPLINDEWYFGIDEVTEE